VVKWGLRSGDLVDMGESTVDSLQLTAYSGGREGGKLCGCAECEGIFFRGKDLGEVECGF
jgi:hypothetical protein